ncbi:lanthionine synthetase [Microbispora triticiradicis]|uniref:Lanthionine synthetase n=1 Tax=Microbispora triticiradicis TaxID=2200763 RepID=A0ABX9LPU7_9ACTN|nr:lanthionine synthetase C family protein [Microbispora triticiradicis]RGA05563.1 lanthionine synthetase [Microbispora triticiradicis]
MTTDPLEVAVHVADRLARPEDSGPQAGESWWPQSLAHGAPGVALLHVELAAHGAAPWDRVHAWLCAATWATVTGGPDSHLYYGAPAVAHVVACAADHQPGAYRRALDALNRQITVDALTRARAGHARIDADTLPTLSEFDLIRGLSGIGAYLLRRDPGGAALTAVLEYLVRLTEPITVDGETLPGWWAQVGPSGRPDLPGGHANHGMAHGVGGPLALLALAALHGVTVTGHHDAIARILTWLDQWRTHNGWPYWVTRPQLHAGQIMATPVRRPSWCYGTVGLARAQQLAALATGDSTRRRHAENALLRAVTDPMHLLAATDDSLCHGRAGFAHLALRAAADAAPDPGLRLRAAALRLLEVMHPPGTDAKDTAGRLLTQAGPEFLEGAAGTALTFATAASPSGPVTGWDTCLLIS